MKIWLPILPIIEGTQQGLFGGGLHVEEDKP